MKFLFNSTIFFIFYIGTIFVVSIFTIFLKINIPILLILIFLSIVIWNILLCYNKKIADIFEIFMLIFMTSSFIKIGIFFMSLF
jgi:hypothetical protein